MLAHSGHWPLYEYFIIVIIIIFFQELCLSLLSFNYTHQSIFMAFGYAHCMYYIWIDEWLVGLVGRSVVRMDGGMLCCVNALYCIAMHIHIKRINNLNTHILMLICKH